MTQAQYKIVFPELYKTMAFFVKSDIEIYGVCRQSTCEMVVLQLGEKVGTQLIKSYEA